MSCLSSSQSFDDLPRVRLPETTPPRLSEMTRQRRKPLDDNVISVYSSGYNSITLSRRYLAELLKDESIALGDARSQPLFVEDTGNAYRVTLLIGANNPCNIIIAIDVELHLIIDTNYRIRLPVFIGDRSEPYAPGDVTVTSFIPIASVRFACIDRGLPAIKTIQVNDVRISDDNDEKRRKCMEAIRITGILGKSRGLIGH